MKKEWIEAIGKMTYGIYVLTTADREEINGMIASWVCQVSYDPPLIMVAVHPHRYSHQLLEKSGTFTLHILDKNQKELLSRFKGPDPEAKFSGIPWSRGRTGCPVLEDCVAYMECRVKSSLTPGNHTLFIGEILDARRLTDDEALSTMDYHGIYLGKD